MLSQTPVEDPRMPIPPSLLPSLPAWQMVRPSIICPGSRELAALDGQHLPVWSMSSSDGSNVIEEQPGKATLTELDGEYAVTDGDGNEVYAGSEVGAELAFWRTTFGVPVDSEVGL